MLDNILMLDFKLKSMISSLSLGLILSLSLTSLMNQAKPSRAELKLLHFITSSSLNIICRLVSSSSQTWTFHFCYRAELEHSLLDKARPLHFIWSRVLGEVRLLKNSPHYKIKLRDWICRCRDEALSGGRKGSS